MASILDAVQELVTPDLLSGLRGQTGDSEATLSKGFGAVLPLLLAALANRRDDHSFMTQVASIAAVTARDPDALTRLSQAAAGATGVDTNTATGRWLSSLLGSNLGSVADAVARYANTSSGTSARLLSLGAPLILGYLGRMMRRDGLNAVGLADRLRDESRTLASAVPSGLESLLPALGRAPVEAARSIDRDIRVGAETLPQVEEPAERSNRGWIVPLLLAALALGGWMLWHGHNRTRVETRAANVETRTLTELPKPVGTTGVIPTAPLQASSSEWARFERLEFENASSTLTSASRDEIGRIAAALNAHPDARIRINGYTDSYGSEAANKRLSRSRAGIVMDALKGTGISADRMEVAGHGSQNPVASNATEEGRAQNRRVTVEVTDR